MLDFMDGCIDGRVVVLFLLSPWKRCTYPRHPKVHKVVSSNSERQWAALACRGSFEAFELSG